MTTVAEQKSGMGIVCEYADFRGSRFWRPRILFSVLAEPLFIKKNPKNTIKQIDYYIAPRPPSAICTCRPVTYLWKLG